MPRLLHHLQVELRPTLLQFIGSRERTDHVEPTVDQHARKIETTLGNAGQRTVLGVVEKAVVGQVVCLTAGHAPRRFRGAERPAPGQRGTGGLVAGPGFPRRQSHPTVAVVQPFAIARKRVPATILGQGLQPSAVGVGVEPAQPVEEPFAVCPPTQEQPAQNQPAHGVGVLPRVGQCQRRAPGSTKHQPLVDAEMAPERIGIRDKVPGGVGPQAATGGRAPGAALVKLDHAVVAEVEEPPGPRVGAGPGAAVQADHRQALGVARLFVVQAVPIRDREITAVVGLFVLSAL